jgi:hypothetical protein
MTQKIPTMHHPQPVRLTQTAMGDLFAPAVFEAAYFSDGIRVRVDILERSDWASGTSLRQNHPRRRKKSMFRMGGPIYLPCPIGGFLVRSLRRSETTEASSIDFEGN